MLNADPQAAHVIKFCYERFGAAPVVVRTDPMPGEAQAECFVTVEKQVARFGGERVIGWAIWELPGILVEAEFHAVWRAPSGELVDVAQRVMRCDAITFVIDANREYQGLALDNIRKPLIFDHDVLALIEFLKERFAVMNSPKRAHQYGEDIQWSRAELIELARINRGIAEAERAIESKFAGGK